MSVGLIALVIFFVIVNLCLAFGMKYREALGAGAFGCGAMTVAGIAILALCVFGFMILVLVIVAFSL